MTNHYDILSLQAALEEQAAITKLRRPVPEAGDNKRSVLEKAADFIKKQKNKKIREEQRRKEQADKILDYERARRDKVDRVLEEERARKGEAEKILEEERARRGETDRVLEEERMRRVNAELRVVQLEALEARRNSAVESDLIKLGKQMKLVYNDLVEKRVPEPAVCGLLCQGENLNTYVMDMPSPYTYRMVKLSKVAICRNIEELNLLPSFISKLVQVKNITLENVKKAEDYIITASSLMHCHATLRNHGFPIIHFDY